MVLGTERCCSFGTFHQAGAYKYMGEWDADVRHGRGRCTFVGGIEYDGALRRRRRRRRRRPFLFNPAKAFPPDFDQIESETAGWLLWGSIAHCLVWGELWVP